MIGGNITVTIQKKITGPKNSIGEKVESWQTVGSCVGWLDYASGQNDISQYRAKVQDTTHFFICDRSKWISAIQDVEITAENCRLIIDSITYEVLMIDDPMNLHDHLEIFLKYVGGGLGV